MQKLLSVAILFCLICPVLAQDDTPATQPDRPHFLQDVQNIAAKMTWLNISEIEYDRRDRPTLPGATENHAMLDQLLNPPTPIGQILPLLKDADSRIRTLGAALLYQNGSMKDMGALSPLLADQAATFPMPPALSQQGDEAHAGENVQLEPQTVAQVVGPLLEMYMTCIDPNGMTPQDRMPENWQHYWDDRKNLSPPTADFIVKYIRATSGVTPLQPERMVKVHRVLDSVFSLPDERQFYVLLMIDYMGDDTVDQAILLQLARRTPREQRLAVIEGRNILGDVDLPPDWVAAYFLKHPHELLLPSDADWLLKIATDRADKTKSKIEPMGKADPLLFIAAAALQPQRAEVILHQAITSYAGEYDLERRCEVAKAMFDVQGEAAMPALLDWLFDDKPEVGAVPGARTEFLRHASQSNPALYRKLVRAIIDDKRLDKLGTWSMVNIVESVSGWLGEQLVDEDEIRHANGVTEDGRDGPYEKLPQWRDKLRASEAKWK